MCWRNSTAKPGPERVICDSSSIGNTASAAAGCRVPDGDRARLHREVHQQLVSMVRSEERANGMELLNFSAYYEHLVTRPRTRLLGGCGVQNCGLVIADGSSAKGCDGIRRSSVRGLLPTLMQLGQQSDWDAYLKMVYGKNVQYPVVLSDFNWFYFDRFPLRRTVHPVLLDIYSRSVTGHAFQPWEEFRWPERKKIGFFVQSFNPELPVESQPEPLRSGFANDTWVEVMRARIWHPDESLGTWYWHAKGSGVWINLGRTLVVDRACERTALGLLTPSISRAKQYDTAQLTVSAHTLPHAMTNSRFEIVDFRKHAAPPTAQSLSVCPPPAADARKGWLHTEPCRCNARAQTMINCASKLPPFA